MWDRRGVSIFCLLLVVSPGVALLAAPRPSAVVSSKPAVLPEIPADLPLEERVFTGADYIKDTRLFGDPRTGRLWELDVAKDGTYKILFFQQMKPWKPRVPLAPLATWLARPRLEPAPGKSSP